MHPPKYLFPILFLLALGCAAPAATDAMASAVAAAASADVAVVVVGNDDAWETEGRDRNTVTLPGRQNELVERVAAANHKTIVVVNAGCPMDLPWADRVAAALGRCAALAAADRPTPDSATTTIPGRSPATILAT